MYTGLKPISTTLTYELVKGALVYPDTGTCGTLVT